MYSVLDEFGIFSAGKAAKIFGISARFKGGKGGGRSRPPPPPPPVPQHVSLDPEVQQKLRDKRRQRLIASGRESTILTQSASLNQNESLLGRSS